MTPLVSIIVPSFNQGRFIRDTIESCLRQDYRPLEVVIIDGASTDGTLEVLRAFGEAPEVKWISEPDSGVAEAVNKGLAMAHGEIAGIQSSDDSYTDGAVSQAVDVFRREPQLGIVYADCVNVTPTGETVSCFRSGPFTLESFLCKGSLILQPAAFFRLSLARKLGGWDPEYFTCDTELWLRMLYQAPARKVDAIWGRRVMHDAQRNNRGREIIESEWKMVRSSRDLAAGPARMRRAARCGAFLTSAGYDDRGELWRRYYLWRAFLAFPQVLASRPKLIGQLLPGYWAVMQMRSRIRSRIGRLARAARRRLGRVAPSEGDERLRGRDC